MFPGPPHPVREEGLLSPGPSPHPSRNRRPKVLPERHPEGGGQRPSPSQVSGIREGVPRASLAAAFQSLLPGRAQAFLSLWIGGRSRWHPLPSPGPIWCSWPLRGHLDHPRAPSPATFQPGRVLLGGEATRYHFAQNRGPPGRDPGGGGGGAEGAPAGQPCFPEVGPSPGSPPLAAGGPPRSLRPQLLGDRGPGTSDPLPHFHDRPGTEGDLEPGTEGDP